MWTLAVAPLDLAGEVDPPRDQTQREAVNGSVVSEKFSNLCSCAVTLIQSGLYRTPFLLIDFHEHLLLLLTSILVPRAIGSKTSFRFSLTPLRRSVS